MNRSHIIFSLLLTCAVAQAQPAATQLPDGLRTLIQQANANYPLLKQQQEQIRAGELRVDVAHTAMRPSVNLNGNYTYITPVPQFAVPLNGQEVVAKLAPNHSLNGNVSIGQTIYDFGRTEAAVRQAQDNVQVLRRGLEISQQNLAYQVAGAYYGIGFLQRGIIVQDSVIKTAGANVQLLATRFQNGDALEYDVLTQTVRVKTAQNRKIELQNQLERQLANLTFLTGNPAPDVSQALNQFDLGDATGVTTQPYDLSGDLSVASAANKDVLLAQDRLQSAETDIVAAKQAGRPNIAFAGNAGYKNGYPLNVQQLRPNLAAGIGLVVPLYAGKRYQLQNQIAQVNVTASRYAVETANAQLRQSIALVNADIRSNQSRLANLETQVLQSRKALDIANARLRNGIITDVELQSAEVGVEEAELGRLNFKYQLLLNQLELKRLLGEGL